MPHFNRFRDLFQAPAAMTCLIFPSFTIEDTPQVLLQALAMVKPVIAIRSCYDLSDR